MGAFLKRAFFKGVKWLNGLFSEENGVPSLRRVLAFFLTVDFIINAHNSSAIAIRVLKLTAADKAVGADIITSFGTNLSQIVMILGIEAGLIAALLGLSTYSSIVTKKIEGAAASQQAAADTDAAKVIAAAAGDNGEKLPKV